MVIEHSILRGGSALLVASALTSVSFVVLGLLAPAWAIPMLYNRPWDDLPLGTGFMVVLYAAPVAVCHVLVLHDLVLFFYKRWSPPSTVQ
jgi:hypothetical protein